MDKSTVFNLLESKTLRDWREQVEDADECGYFAEVQKLTDELKSELTEPTKELLNAIRLTTINAMDYLHINLDIKIFNLGILIGCELKEAFEEFEE